MADSGAGSDIGNATVPDNQVSPSTKQNRVGIWLMLAAVALGVVTVFVGTRDLTDGEEPNRLATSLLQAITLVFGTYGSFMLGKDASRQAAQEAVRPHAKSAFRRVMTLYQALGRLKQATEAEAAYLEGQVVVVDGNKLLSADLALASLDKLRLMSREQIATADDALEDWRDLAPDEVAKIERAAVEAKPSELGETL